MGRSVQEFQDNPQVVEEHESRVIELLESHEDEGGIPVENCYDDYFGELIYEET